jgi:hypothetical protein
MHVQSITSPEFQQRFFARMIRTPDGCLVWTGSLTKGYGQVKCDGKNQYTHRVAWRIANGPIPDGLLVLHHCDNPICCDVEHLFLGTDLDNHQDCVQKGRVRYSHHYGEQNGSAKLTAADVLEILRVYVPRSREFSTFALAQRFGVTHSVISRVVLRQLWTHI